MLARGWIVPVGGATPDRLKSTGTRPDRLGRHKVEGQPPIGIRSTGLAGSMGGAGGRGEILLSVYVYADGRLGPYWGGRAAIRYAYAPFVTMIEIDLTNIRVYPAPTRVANFLL